MNRRMHIKVTQNGWIGIITASVLVLCLGFGAFLALRGKDDPNLSDVGKWAQSAESPAYAKVLAADTALVAATGKGGPAKILPACQNLAGAVNSAKSAPTPPTAAAEEAWTAALEGYADGSLQCNLAMTSRGTQSSNALLASVKGLSTARSQMAILRTLSTAGV